MPTEVIVAIIAAAVAVIGSVFTLTIGMGQLRNERSKIRDAGLRLELESQQAVQQTMLRTAEAKKMEAEARAMEHQANKMRAESYKLLAETQEIRRRWIEADREEIRELLMLFDRAAFDAPMNSENPAEMFRAIRDTRHALQERGASLVRSPKIAASFGALRRLLLDTEMAVRERYPELARLASEVQTNWSPGLSRYDVDATLREALESEYWEPVRMMMGIRPELDRLVASIRTQYEHLGEGADPVS